MKKLTPSSARELRLSTGKRLMDIAFHANCAPQTVRSFELGATVRPAILERLLETYPRVCKSKRK